MTGFVLFREYIFNNSLHKVLFPAVVATVTSFVMFVVCGEAVLQEDKSILCAGLPHEAADKTIGFPQMPHQIKVRPVGGGFCGTAAAEVLQGQAVTFDGIILNVAVGL